jgi:hypothetical protein
MGKSHVMMGSEPHQMSSPSDNLEMVADLFTAMKVAGKEPDMPISEIADIGQQLIDMIRQRDNEIRELRRMNEALMANTVQGAEWNPENQGWVVGGKTPWR